MHSDASWGCFDREIALPGTMQLTRVQQNGAMGWLSLPSHSGLVVQQFRAMFNSPRARAILGSVGLAGADKACEANQSSLKLILGGLLLQQMAACFCNAVCNQSNGFGGRISEDYLSSTEPGNKHGLEIDANEPA